MPQTRTAGGPFGRGSYRFSWNGQRFLRAVEQAAVSEAHQLTRELLVYLHNTLHRWTGQMAREAFADVYFTTAGQLVVRYGSDAPHTFWHEVRWHPQLRETAQLWMPIIQRRIAMAMGKAAA